MPQSKVLKVYVLMSCEHGRDQIRGVFSTEEKALKYGESRNFKDGYYADEYEVDSNE